MQEDGGREEEMACVWGFIAGNEGDVAVAVTLDEAVVGRRGLERLLVGDSATAQTTPRDDLKPIQLRLYQSLQALETVLAPIRRCSCPVSKN